MSAHQRQQHIKQFRAPNLKSGNAVDPSASKLSLYGIQLYCIRSQEIDGQQVTEQEMQNHGF